MITSGRNKQHKVKLKKAKTTRGKLDLRLKKNCSLVIVKAVKLNSGKLHLAENKQNITNSIVHFTICIFYLKNKKK